MKSIKLILAVLFISFSLAGVAQEEEKKKGKEIKVLEIKTSSQCEICKERIEKNMAYEKGVKFVELDVETKILTLKYREDKTTPEQLRKAVSKIGYDADDVEADPVAYEKLPACCQKGGHDHE